MVNIELEKIRLEGTAAEVWDDELKLLEDSYPGTRHGRACNLIMPLHSITAEFRTIGPSRKIAHIAGVVQGSSF